MKVENELFPGSLSPSSKIKRTQNGSPQDSKVKRNGVDSELDHVFSYKFRDKNIKLSNDRLSATGYKGWSSVFGTHCSCRGKWYFEIKVNGDFKNLKFVGHDSSVKNDLKSHVRVGYSCRYQRYDMPIGVNTYGFSISDIDGKAVYDSVKYDYAVPFGIGDVVGCYISLEEPTTDFYDPRDDLKLYEFLREGMLCDPKNIPDSKSNPDSFAYFSINGQVFPKVDFKIYDGYYHPAVSLYMGACVTLNLGPHFDFEPPEEYKPCCLMDRPLIN